MIAELANIPWSDLQEIDTDFYRFSFETAFPGTSLRYSYQPDTPINFFCAIFDRPRNLILELKFKGERTTLGLPGQVTIADQYYAEQNWHDMLNPQHAFSFQLPILIAAERVTTELLALNSMELAYHLTRTCHLDKLAGIFFIVFADLTRPCQLYNACPDKLLDLSWRSFSEIPERLEQYDRISQYIAKQL